MDLSDCLYESLAYGRVGGVRVFGIVEARVSVGDEMKGRAHLQSQIHGLGVRGLLRMGAGAGNAAEKENHKGQFAKKFHLAAHRAFVEGSFHRSIVW